MTMSWSPPPSPARAKLPQPDPPLQLSASAPGASARAPLRPRRSRPGATPNPAVREVHLVDDEVVCAVPSAHPWSRLDRISLKEFLRTPMVMRDPQSNSRWTVESVLRKHGWEHADPLVQAATPVAALREALQRNAPVLLLSLIHISEPTRPY